MNFIHQLRTQLTTLWGQLSTRQRIAIGAGGGSVLVAVAILVALSGPVSYEILFTSLSVEDSTAIRAELSSMAVPFTLEQSGGTILVPADRVADVRLSLAGRGLFENRGRGFELFDGSGLGMTDFVQNVNYHRALEGELARSIATLHSVERVRVHLVLPRQSLFLEERTEPKASVVLKLRSGKRLARREAEAVCQLVAAAVEGLKPAAVMLVSDRGEILSAPVQDEEAEESSKQMEQYEAISKLESQLSGKVIALLEPIVGEGRVRARATIEIDRTRTDETVELYDPERSVVRSQQTEKGAGGATEPGGVAGAPSNVGDTSAQTSTAQQHSEQKETINYEVSRSIRKIFGSAGRIRRLSIGVVVDDRSQTSGTPQKISWTPEQLLKLQEIVAAAVGMDVERGDTVRIDNFSFALDEIGAAQAEAEAKASSQSGISLIHVGLVVVILVLAAMAWRGRSRRPSLLLPAGSPLPAALLSAGPRSLQDLEAELNGDVETAGIQLSPALRRASQLKDQILQHVNDDPMVVTELIRSWITESMGTNQEPFSQENQFHG